jgi:hypothetical protein
MVSVNEIEMTDAEIERGWELTEAICKIIDDEMAHSADGTWDYDTVAPKVAELLLGTALDEHQAIVDAVLFCDPVGTNNILPGGTVH